MVCGIVSFFCFGFILGALAVILGAVGLSQSKAAGVGNGMAVAGIVLGIIAVLVYILILVLVPSFFAGLFGMSL